MNSAGAVCSSVIFWGLMILVIFWGLIIGSLFFSQGSADSDSDDAIVSQTTKYRWTSATGNPTHYDLQLQWVSIIRIEAMGNEAELEIPNWPSLMEDVEFSIQVRAVSETEDVESQGAWGPRFHILLRELEESNE